MLKRVTPVMKVATVCVRINTILKMIKRKDPIFRFFLFNTRTIYRIIKKGVDNGDFREIDVKVATICVISMIIRAELWYSPRGRLSIDEIANIMADFIHNALVKGNRG